MEVQSWQLTFAVIRIHILRQQADKHLCQAVLPLVTCKQGCNCDKHVGLRPSYSLHNSCHLFELLVKVLQRTKENLRIKPVINYTDNSTFTSTNTDLELWNGHLKRPLTNLSRGLNDLQQQRHIWGVERSAGVGAHRHAELPLHVHQLQRRSKTTNETSLISLENRQILSSGHQKIFENERDSFNAFNLDIPGWCWAWPGPPAEYGLTHHVHSTTCATPEGKL